jgi:hypothetical protein
MNLTQMFRRAIGLGNLLGLDAANSLVMKGSKIYWGQDTNTTGVVDLTTLGPGVTSAVPVWTKITASAPLLYSAFAAAALSNTVPLFVLPAAGIIHGIKIKHSTAFSGPGITGYTLSVGDAAFVDDIASAFNVLQAVSATAYQLSATLQGESHGAPTTINVTATSTGANLNAATAGAVDIWALTSVAT